MSVVLFPNAPSGPRPCGTFVLKLPLIAIRVEPQLYFDVAPEDQKAIVAEIAYMRAAIDEAGRSVERLMELMIPYGVKEQGDA